MIKETFSMLNFKPTPEDVRSMAQYDSLFPLHRFPEPIRTLLEEAHSKQGFPLDFIGASILTAIAAAIGNQAVIEVKEGWQERCVLYTVLVGAAGANKSHPMTFAMKPLLDEDIKSMNRYKAEVHRLMGSDEQPQPPIRRVVSDTTIEGLAALHTTNRDGLILFADELKSWISNFTRYSSSSSQEQFWLSNFSSKPIIVDRRDTERSMAIEHPFICVMGSTQPAVLRSFAAGDRAYNGFIDRLLYAIVEKSPKPYWCNETMDQSLVERYEGMIRQILDLASSLSCYSSPSPLVVRFSPDAYELLSEWQRYNTDLVNRSCEDIVVGMQIKLEAYAIRFSLVVHMMRYFSTRAVTHIEEVDRDSVDLALYLTEYFRAQAFTAHKIITNLNGEAEKGSPAATFFDALPQRFGYDDILTAASAASISLSSGYRLLRKHEGERCTKLGYGQYVKV